MRRISFAACLLLSAAITGATALHAQAPATTFSEVAVASGIDFEHQTFANDGEIMWGGAAAGDFNSDGLPDLFVLGGGMGGAPGADALYINQGDGTFENMAEQAGLAFSHIGAGAAVADYNGDGRLDIYVTSHGTVDAMGPGQHKLYRNNGNLTFTDVAAEAGVQQTTPNVADGFGASFGDYDLDGDLDLFVGGWMRNARGNRLFRNEGDGAFTDVTATSFTNINLLAANIHGFSPCFVDMDGDRYPELLLTSDFGTSHYFVNQGDGTFADNTVASGVGLEWSGMGSTVGDFNHDGLADWMVTAIYDDDNVGRGDGNKLYFNLGNHLFSERARASKVDDGGWGWGVVAVDLNHDGWLDLVENNGWGLPSYTNERAKVWINNGTHVFSDQAAAAGLDHRMYGLGALRFDYDLDGDQDIVLTAGNDRLTLYRNNLSGPNTHWLRIALDTHGDAPLAPNGIGSRIAVSAGGQTQYGYMLACPHYLSQSELTVHFGLGSATTVDEVRVEWADGRTTILTDLPADQSLTISSPGSVSQFCAAEDNPCQGLFLPFARGE